MTSILIIDDDPQTRTMLRKMLERKGYEIVEAREGREGLRLYNATPAIDVVITDILMPEQEGLETIRALRRTSPEVKIIAISGGGRTGTLDFLPVAAKLGAQCTLHKPIAWQTLLQAVRALVPDAMEVL
ncbi:MAG TPA: response regulator [Candidatus Tectomicrobia bacterium]